MKIKIIIKIFIKCCLALSVLILLVYPRLLTREARDLCQNMNFEQLFFLCITLIGILANIYAIFLTLGLVIGEKKEFKFMIYIKKTFAIVSESFVTLYCVFWEIVENLVEKLFKIQNFQYNSGRRLLLFANKEKYWKYYAIFLLSLNFFPRFLLLLCFIVEVFIFHRLHYTFLFIPFLLLPLISKFIVFCLKQHHEEFRDDIYSLVEKHVTNKGIYFYCYKPQFRENPPPEVKNFEDFFNNHFVVMVNLGDSLKAYETLRNSPSANYTLLFLAFFRLFAYLFILYYGVAYTNLCV